MAKSNIQDRIYLLPKDKWLSLNQVCQIFETTALTHTKMHLLSHPDIEYKRVIVPKKTKKLVPDTWRWMFKRVGDGK